MEDIGVEPMTPCVQGRCSKPTELIPHYNLIMRLFENLIMIIQICIIFKFAHFQIG